MKKDSNAVADERNLYENTIHNAVADVRNLYENTYHEDCTLAPLSGSGSERSYFRVAGKSGTVIGTYGNDRRENEAFIGLSEAFRKAGQNVPAILAVDDDCTAYLQEDLGDTSLLQLLSGPDRVALSENVMGKLVELQTLPPEIWRDRVFNKGFGRRQVMWDLNYFKYEFLKPAGIIADEDSLEDDFEHLVDKLVHDGSRLWGFMYRDFQSRNILIHENEPWWIDYQGGRFGPMIYDAVSFLWQAKAGFTDDERRHLLDVYARKMSDCRNVKPEEVLSQVREFALFRTLQVLGAYGFRGLVEKKSHFIESIPAAIENLNDLLLYGTMDDMPELKKATELLMESRFVHPVDSVDGLTLTVFSFSYKKGYPEDLTGNGGGFMFDCRGMHNPGRYEEYKQLTGRDQPVKDFLEQRGEVQGFVDKAVELVNMSVMCYLRRGFRNLQVGFGCTGGRHRSVYCADRFARAMAFLYPDVIVKVVHREQPALSEDWIQLM